MLSYPKSKIRVVLAEKIHASAVETFREAGYEVESVAHALDSDELARVIEDVHILGLRSRTKVTAAHLGKARRLLAIGSFAIGTDQVALDTATSGGVPVFNAPHSSTRSVAEMTIANVVNLARRIPEASSRMHQGRWEKTAVGAVEVRNKTLGIIGYGHIGQQVGLLGEMLGLDVLFYDVLKKLPLGRARAVSSLADVLGHSNFVTLHVPGGASTRNMIGKAELAAMRKGAFFINASRGSVVDLDALRASLVGGHIGGAALDVFPQEPAEARAAFEHPLQGVPNVILTPHVGGSTEEAQRNIGREVATSLVSFLDTGATQGAVNFPAVNLPPFPEGHRILNIHRNVPGVLSAINHVIAEVGANIHAQYLNTWKDIGYLIMDIDHTVSEEVRERISALPDTVRTRVLH